MLWRQRLRNVVSWKYTLQTQVSIYKTLKMWRDHYSDIFNSVNQKIDVVYKVDESTDFGDVVVLSEEVERAVRELVVNKSCGIDGIYAEHNLLMFCFVCSPSVCLAFWFMVSCLMR